MVSVWSELDSNQGKVLDKDIEVDAVVIGGGIAGLLTAYMLSEKNINVVLIEAKKILSGNTKNTTAKITSQHELIYSKLIKEFGKDKAQQYANANEKAISKFSDIINERKIECDFEKLPAYIYSLGETESLIDEYNAAKELGIDAEYVEETDLPICVKGAVKFNNQAQFHPIKFLREISKNLIIYEGTRAIGVEENLVITDKGKITAKHIVVATHYPIINTPGYYFLRMHQERSYVIALENASNVNGMYIDIDKSGYSFRNYKDLLLLGGIPSRTGKNESGGSFNKLREAAKVLFPDAKEKYHWSAQDCMTLDGIPYIGEYSTSTNNLYVITGFNKWGMTSSMVGAMIVSDMILGIENDFKDIFSPTRFDMSLSANNIVDDVYETAKNFIAQKINIPSEQISHIENGNGKIVEFEGEKVGVYKDEKGKSYIVTTKCPHLGCELKWNPDDLSWDCPCHGSRFDYKGIILDSPANKNLVKE